MADKPQDDSASNGSDGPDETALILADLALRARNDPEYYEKLKSAKAADLKELGLSDLTLTDFKTRLSSTIDQIGALEMAMQQAGTSAATMASSTQAGGTAASVGTVGSVGSVCGTAATFATAGTAGSGGAASTPLGGGGPQGAAATSVTIASLRPAPCFPCGTIATLPPPPPCGTVATLPPPPPPVD